MLLPAPKLLKVIRGATFDYYFQYLKGAPNNATAVDLSGCSASWTIHDQSGALVATYVTGALAGHSGVFFGGDNHDPTNGKIDMVISATDTAAITWTTGTYNLVITNPATNPATVTPLLTGGIGIVGTLP